MSARAHIITEFEGAGPSFKSLSEDGLKSHLRDMWEFMYHKTWQHAPVAAASLVSRIIRRVPLSHIQQLLLDDTFVFSISNINQVLERFGDTGANGDEPSVEDETDYTTDDDSDDDEDEDEDDDEDEEDDEDDEDADALEEVD